LGVNLGVGNDVWMMGPYEKVLFLRLPYAEGFKNWGNCQKRLFLWG